MRIDFNEIPEKIVPNMRGGNREFRLKESNDGAVKIIRGRLIPGASIGTHTHVTNSETIFVLEGTGRAMHEGKEEILTPGLCHYCPQGQAHSLENIGDTDLIFFAVIPERG